MAFHGVGENLSLEDSHWLCVRRFCQSRDVVCSSGLSLFGLAVRGSETTTARHVAQAICNASWVIVDGRRSPRVTVADPCSLGKMDGAWATEIALGWMGVPVDYLAVGEASVFEFHMPAGFQDDLAGGAALAARVGRIHVWDAAGCEGRKHVWVYWAKVSGSGEMNVDREVVEESHRQAIEERDEMPRTAFIDEMIGRVCACVLRHATNNYVLALYDCFRSAAWFARMLKTGIRASSFQSRGLPFVGFDEDDGHALARDLAVVAVFPGGKVDDTVLNREMDSVNCIVHPNGTEMIVMAGWRPVHFERNWRSISVFPGFGVLGYRIAVKSWMGVEGHEQSMTMVCADRVPISAVQPGGFPEAMPTNLLARLDALSFRAPPHWPL